MYAVHLASAVALMLVFFERNPMGLLIGIDGAYVQILQRLASEWQDFDLTFSSNLITSYGNIWFSLNERATHHFLLHGWLEGWLEGGLDPPLRYAVVGLELFASTVFVARCFGFSRGTAIASGWALIALVMPFSGTAWFYQSLDLVPWSGTVIAGTATLIGLFALLGRGKPVGSFGALVGMVSILVIMLAANAVSLVLMFPAVAIFALGLLARATSRAEVFWKLGMVGGTGLLGISLAWPQYLLGLLGYSAAAVFGAEMDSSSRQSALDISVLFHSWAMGHAAWWLVPGAILGALFHIIWVPDGRRTAAIALLAGMLAVLVAGLVMMRVEKWNGPAPLYFERQLWPFFVIVTVSSGAHALAWIRTTVWGDAAALGKGGILAAGAPLLMALVPWVLVPTTEAKATRIHWPYPPQSSPITDVLTAEVGLTPGAMLRGRVATFAGNKPAAEGSAWSDQHAADARAYQQHGLRNAHRSTGLWYFGIPTLFEYSPQISPAFFALTRRFLTSKNDRPSRSIVLLTTPDLRILRMLGVSHVITRGRQSRLDVLPPVATSMVRDDDSYILRRLPGSNTSGVTPTQLRVEQRLDSSLEAIGQRTFNWREEVIVHESSADLPSSLRRADRHVVTVHRDGIHIRASSPGTSVLVLPFEFSHCFDLRQTGSSSGGKIYSLQRANLVQTALFFEGEITVVLQFRLGPFHNQQCRLEDKRQFRRLME